MILMLSMWKCYLGTLSIPQKPFYTTHSQKDVITSTPYWDKRDNSVQKLSGDPDFVCDYI